MNSPLTTLEGDFFGFESLLSGVEQEIVALVRDFLRTEVEPIANEYWARAEFPFQLVDGFRKLDIAGLMYDGLAAHRGTRLLTGFLALEICRTDPSINTFYGVHTGLAMGSVNRCGSPEQKERWLPAMARLEKIGAFALTEPHGGSDVAGGLETTARRDGDHWVLNGEKKWIGNATFADLVVVWARDEEDRHVKGFVVEKGTPGFHPEKIEGKIALRTVQNAQITFTDCVVPEENRLQNARTFRDTSDVLRQTRGGVAWGSVGCMMAAYELALDYAREREQFGRPIAKFQLIQDHLATMLGNVTSSLALVVRLAQLQDSGVNKDEHSAMAKSVVTTRMRETVALAREVFGGNGILLENSVARFFADAEALYSYEGTREINQLIVGRAITGMGAFV
ncbi:glutaryl-CoA dehydrogenase [Amycolatopsis bartoniae]|uniref:Glutaryl-CoA dehydrogenase n=1 Tax=Amycolatopsis bartoniae TaxID=941986 RepID=A0A8H9IXC2_9PSEU|nr:acyl-CoA dehydrogenase family protein [Amycolatopsis bartoniae]MBB2937107.1 glutaryl-CoA dehydrogenase [Amycolatopsis bartoniae]TVT04764.1 acyl-CoA dehydrogenase [Amycolatopsis bartoniae]GHF52481.1 glutaryl-CoA dehydrogenase [Amycolatopsis bartoniae]